MKFLLVAATLIAVAYGHSPVLLWPAEEFAVPEGQSALDSMNLDDFKKMFKGKNIIVFHKKQFMLEEVSYPTKQLSYLQSVDAFALQGVKSIHHFVAGLSPAANLKIVPLGDGALDEQQDEIKNTMDSNPGFAAILVGSGSHRSRRAADPKAKCTSTGTDSCLAYVENVVVTTKEGSKEVGCTVKCHNNTGITVTIEGGIELTVLKDPLSGGYNLNTSESHRIDSDTTWAPNGFSYSCAALRLVPRTKTSDDKASTITLKRVQLWPDKPTIKDKENEFPEAYDCATWFTPAIWMGVVIASFYIFLLFGAVVFLLDVKTNDRFDDPKGKTITVNVAE